MTAAPARKNSLLSRWPLILVLFILTVFFVYVSRQKNPSAPPPDTVSSSRASSPATTPVSAATDATHPGMYYPSQGHDHWDLARLQKFQYNSNPPTSGPHMEQFIDSYTPSSPLPAYIQVHLLEHGNVLIQYNCTCPHTVEALKKIASSFDTYSPSLGLEEGKAVIVAPNPSLPHRIVLTAWTRLLGMDTLDEKAAGQFISTWLGNAQNTRQ
ncbi:DUF3105 domain-containing protein [Leptospirillum ferriphilum]|jgi:hypothetical protein|uniref:DUF3105 domain-containing protein n=2 Tax=Leptospirillum TaxID=179 RepID=A0A094W6U2_9BACT|nr:MULTISPECIES: DUF3105 domain-containing protein [Leptospirillum]EAY57263.1 MAG: protein of unknown function [Leptospirillum rubarum]EDZ38741.1 MAG: Protein of unknown function [Leptospirillum sp. Group II '5-way CG']EIJ77352.1 MAG: hypothetical protein C75L2_00720005 [Leptospirillum sp. Group II 'C75']AKS23799.1 hypothetical protein ABH19_08700 [Leptospirillum sp. Group II 'CF-1']KGA93183.1 hypothetical protein LptCag_1878 [Leptospirillum ferriphilum]